MPAAINLKAFKPPGEIQAPETFAIQLFP